MAVTGGDDLHGGGGEGCHLLLETVSETRQHGAAPRQHHVCVQRLTHRSVTLLDGPVHQLMKAARFLTLITNKQQVRIVI